MQLIREGKVAEAVKMAHDQVKNSPDSFQTLRSAGVILDLAGRYKEARVYFQDAIELAPNAGEKAAVQREMGGSYGFEGDCKTTTTYLLMVVDYWKTQEGQDKEAFNRQGEVANEAARYCIDAGQLNEAEKLYKLGRELGMKEPDNPARKALWDFRTEHAMVRLAARRGKKADVQKHMAAAKDALDRIKTADAQMGQQQEPFYDYLNGYVALYTGDYKTALDELLKANQNDVFIQALIGMTYEKMGQKDKAIEYYRKANSATAHIPAVAFARRMMREKGAA